MKKYQIFKKIAGQSCVPYKYAIFDTMAEAQDALRRMLKETHQIGTYTSILNYGHYNLDIIERDRKEGIEYVGYTEPGIYEGQGLNINEHCIIELVYSDREINSDDFWRYSYDNWEEYIEEIEVQDENQD